MGVFLSFFGLISKTRKKQTWNPEAILNCDQLLKRYLPCSLCLLFSFKTEICLTFATQIQEDLRPAEAQQLGLGPLLKRPASLWQIVLSTQFSSISSAVMFPIHFKVCAEMTQCSSKFVYLFRSLNIKWRQALPGRIYFWLLLKVTWNWWYPKKFFKPDHSVRKETDGSVSLQQWSVCPGKVSSVAPGVTYFVDWSCWNPLKPFKHCCYRKWNPPLAGFSEYHL